MTRFLLLAATCVALAALSAPASAKVVSKKADQSPEAVEAYWTDERMRTAKPKQRERAGKPGGNGSTSSWSTVRVDWLTAGPELKAHGKVFFTDNGVNYVCSGTAVGGNVVWTAGHCVNEGPGAFYTNFAFVPAYNSNGTRPYGTWAATSLHTTSAWQGSGEFGRDLGAARVAEQSGLTLAGRLGTSRTLDYTPDLTTNGSQTINAYGYPAAGKYNGQSMYVCNTYVNRLDANASPATYGIPCGMTGGSSGGGWVNAAGHVVSVNSYGYQGLKNVMFGPQQDSTAQALFNAANF